MASSMVTSECACARGEAKAAYSDSLYFLSIFDINILSFVALCGRAVRVSDFFPK